MNNLLKYTIILLTLFCSLSFASYVNAETTGGSTSELEEFEPVINNEGNVTCEDLLGSKNDAGSLMNILSDVYNMLRIGAVILVIVLGMVDFTSAVSASDSDKLNKAIKKLTRRLIILVVLFVVPTLLELVLSLVFGPGFLCKL